MFTKSLDQILSSFNKTIASLEQLIDSNNTKHLDNSTRIKSLHDSNESLTQETDKASSIKTKIENLVS